MRQAFEFLFYCLYRMFKVVKRQGVKDEDLAVLFYSMVLWTNFETLLFPLRFVIPKGYFDPPLLRYSLTTLHVSMIFVLYFFCRRYFIASRRYQRIFEYFENPKTNNRHAFIGIAYSLASFVSFIFFAMAISRIKWHI